jgi:hypothetical protein
LLAAALAIAAHILSGKALRRKTACTFYHGWSQRFPYALRAPPCC